MKEYNKLKKEIENLERYREDLTVKQLKINLNSMLYELAKTCQPEEGYDEE